VPADPAPGRLPEATAPQQPPKPAVPKQQLKILDQDSRLEAYGQFRELYEAARFDEALPYAKRVVELSEANPERDHELPIAYNNLGATQYQLGDYTGAEASYAKSLSLLEETQGISSRRLIVPLAGLGAVHAARDQHEAAADLFDRALAVSRRADGLFNLAQVPLIRQAADSRYAFSDYGGAEREHMYALKVAEQNFGYGDMRTLPPLLEFGAFYEGLREFIAARVMYMRARDVALADNRGYSPEAVKALCGLARSHRLQYTMDPESLESQQPGRDVLTGEMVA
jgi:tetratricopeptide (TPR) repeat protein